jgi:MFS family permease
VSAATEVHEARPAATGSIMHVPAARRLVWSYAVSALGSAMVAIAVAFVAFRESRSVVLTVVVLGANALPALLLSPIVGKLATDRDPRNVELVGNVAKIVISLALAVVASAGSLTYIVLVIANVLNGIVSAMVAPAWPQLSRMVAPKGRLTELTALYGTVGSVMAIAGALAGGVVVAVVGAGIVFALNAVSYVPIMFAIKRVPGEPHLGHDDHRAVRRGIEIVRRTEMLKQAFTVAAVLNLAAWPVLSILPAAARDIDARAHVLGLLTGAFFAGAALTAWAVIRLRKRFTFGTILFVGFFSAGMLLMAHATLNAWRTPGYDAVFVSVITLIPMGLALALDGSLLQSLVQLGTPPDDQGPVLVVYATITTIVTPIGGLLLGEIADELSLWGSLAVSGFAIAFLAVLLRKRLRVFDQLGPAPDREGGKHHHHPVHLSLWFGPDALGSIGHLRHTIPEGPEDADAPEGSRA